MVWKELEEAVKEVEKNEGPFGRRICKVFYEGETPSSDVWYGTFGNAEIEAGKTGYQLSDGEIVELDCPLGDKLTVQNT